MFASTGGAIMGNQKPPIDEQSLPWPISPYGASKLCGEAYLHAFAGSFGIRPVALRFANVYGPYSAHKKGVITRFIRAALAGGTFETFLLAHQMNLELLRRVERKRAESADQLAVAVEVEKDQFLGAVFERLHA